MQIRVVWMRNTLPETLFTVTHVKPVKSQWTKHAKVDSKNMICLWDMGFISPQNFGIQPKGNNTKSDFGTWENQILVPYHTHRCCRKYACRRVFASLLPYYHHGSWLGMLPVWRVLLKSFADRIWFLFSAEDPVSSPLWRPLFPSFCRGSKCQVGQHQRVGGGRTSPTRTFPVT